ncbi:MAG: hypothetical protein DRP01_03860, partial [Archaeoglobales archaeon]
EDVKEDIKKKAVKGGVCLVVATMTGNPVAGATASELATYVIDKKDDEVLTYDKLANRMIKVATYSAISQATHGLVTPESIEDIDVKKTSDGKYEMNAKVKVKLFGFIPITMDTKIKTDPKDPGDVEVDLPWWNFLARPY